MPFSHNFCVLRKLDPINSHFRPHRKYSVTATARQKTLLRTTVPFITAHLEIFHCTHHPVIPKSDLYFTFEFCSTLTLIFMGEGGQICHPRQFFATAQKRLALDW